MKRLASFLLGVFTLSILFNFTGCASRPQQSSSSHAASDYITIGTGGGISGAYNGYKLERGGDVYSWTGMPSDPKLSKLFHTSDDSLEFFFRYLNEIDFMSQQLNAPDNMSTFIELHEGDHKNSVTWSSVHLPSQELSTFYSLVGRFIARHK